MDQSSVGTQDGSGERSPKRCFVVSAFGSTADEKTRTKQVLRHLVRKVLEPRGYEVVRADEIDDEGLITNQIIEHLLEDALVVADLTGRNPNVFYEVAVRHAARKPIVHLITAGEQIPFDVANMRAIQYALDDPDLLEEAQEELGRKVAAIEANDGAAALNPITVARDVGLLRGSDNPELREAGDVLAALSDLRDEVHGLSRRMRIDRPPNSADASSSRSEASHRRARRGQVMARELAENGIPLEGGVAILEALLESGPVASRTIASLVMYAPSTVSRYLRQMEGVGMVERLGSHWSLTHGFETYIRDRSEP